jgi:hypothetical protein
MALTVSYECDGQLIPGPIKDCEIVYRDNGVIKIIEHIAFSGVERHTYYLDENEHIESVLRRYTSNYIDIIKRKEFGKYRIEESSIYYAMDILYIGESFI